LNVKIKEYLEVDYNLQVVLKSLLSSVFMGIVLYYAKLIFGDSSISAILLLIFISLIAYIALLFAFKTFSTKELSFARNSVLETIKR